MNTQSLKKTDFAAKQPMMVTNRHVGRDFLVSQPGSQFRLTGFSAHELANEFVDAEAVFSPEIQLVNDRISSTDNHREMTVIVENFMRYLINSRTVLKIWVGKTPPIFTTTVL